MMNGMEIFFIGLFVGAWGMFTFLGIIMLSRSEKEPGKDGN